MRPYGGYRVKPEGELGDARDNNKDIGSGGDEVAKYATAGEDSEGFDTARLGRQCRSRGGHCDLVLRFRR